MQNSYFSECFELLLSKHKFDLIHHSLVLSINSSNKSPFMPDCLQKPIFFVELSVPKEEMK